MPAYAEYGFGFPASSLGLASSTAIVRSYELLACVEGTQLVNTVVRMKIRAMMDVVLVRLNIESSLIIKELPITGYI